MTFLPIVERELRVAARKRVTYSNRVAVAAFAIIVGVFVFFISLGRPVTMASFAIFIGLSAPAAFYCFMAGSIFTVDCLTEEKREGTLGLLFLTDLKGWDIILGKLAATSLNAFFGLFALVPVLAIPLMMGGVSGAQVCRTALVLIVVFLFSLANAIFASAISRTNQTANALSVLMLFWFALIMPGFASWMLYLTSNISVVAQTPLPFLYTSPFFAYAFSLDPLYRAHPADFWLSLLVIHGLTWLFIWGAACVVPYSWQESAPAVPRTVVSTMLGKAASREEMAKRAAHRKRLLDINSIYWLAARDRFKPVRVWIFISLLFFGYIVGAIYLGRDWFTPPSALLACVLLNSTLKLWLASEAGLRFAEEKKSGAIELVLSTSLTVEDFLRGQWLALRRQFFRPFLAVAVFELLLIAVTTSRFDGENSPPLYPFILAGLLMLALDAIALGWVAMHQAFLVPKPPDAGGQAALRVLLLPWLLFIGIMIAAGILSEILGFGDVSPYFALALWVALGLAADSLFGLSARSQLLNRFRYLAATRFSPGRFRFF